MKKGFFELWRGSEEEIMEYNLDLSNYSSSVEESRSKFLSLLQSGRPFSHIRIGDGDAHFLMYEFENEENKKWIKDAHFSLLGIDRNNIPSSKPLVDAIRSATMVGIIEARQITSKAVFYWQGSTYFALLENKLLNKKYDSIGFIYQCVDDGSMFKLLHGKNVVLVGGKAKAFCEYFCNNEQYNSAYPHLNLSGLKMSYIDTPDFEGKLQSNMSTYTELIRKSYAPNTVYLFSCGISAKIWSVMVHKENDSTGIDLGSSIGHLMGIMKRPYMREYVHPEYDFKLTDLSDIEFVRKREITI